MKKLILLASVLLVCSLGYADILIDGDIEGSVATFTDTLSYFGGTTIYNSTISLADTQDLDLSGILGGMQGKGEIIGNEGTTFANFYFTNDGVVTLINNTPDVGTAYDTDEKLNIYDAGTSIRIENQLGKITTFTIRIIASTP